MSISPEQYNRRSFVQRRLVELGAEFVDRGDCAAAGHVPGGEGAPLGLVDRSPLMRTGVKGPGSREFADASGWPVPADNNTADRADNGALVLRLGDNELLVLSDPDADDAPLHALEASLPGAGAWHVPRRDSHCWFLLRGERAADCLAKLCGVDLRPAHFAPGRIAQTSVARLNAIVCREPGDGPLAFHLLADSAAAVWFWDVLLDAMAEFDGRPQGLDDR